MVAYAETAQAGTRCPRDLTGNVTRREGDSSARDAALQKNDFQARYLSLRPAPRPRILKKPARKPSTIADKARSARRYAENPEYFKLKAARWQRENPQGSRTKAAERRALLQQRKCTCCTPAAFCSVYAEAASTDREVDHVTPLCIGGLHCVKNLQLLTPEAHKRKTKADIAELHAF